MTVQNIALFKALGAKLDYLDHQQKITAQNISNADTPNYKARELTDPDFSQVLGKIVKENKVHVDVTKQGHMPSPNEVREGQNRKQGSFYEVAPGKNAVILEEQMLKAQKTSADHSLMMNIMRKNVGMIKTAIGNQGQ